MKGIVRVTVSKKKKNDGIVFFVIIVEKKENSKNSDADRFKLNYC